MLRYTVNGLTARWRSALTTFLAIALTVAAVVVTLGIVEGLLAAILDSGNPANAIVLSKGAPSEDGSSISIEQLDRLKTIPGVAHLSPELVTALSLETKSGGHELVTLRGVDLEAMRAHGAEVVGGAWPQKSAPGLVVGAQRVAQLGDVGASVKVDRGGWPIVGRLQAPGRFESELWCDRDALQNLLKSRSLSSVVVTLDGGAAGQAAFAEQVAKILPNPLEAVSEPDYYRRMSEKTSIYLQAVAIVILALVLGAVFACTNLMYASFLDRLRELGTLVAIGYTRGRVARLVLREGLLLALAGGAAGLALGLAARGHPMSMEAAQLSYHILVTGRVLAAGAAVSALIGILGSTIAAFMALRLNVLTALRG